MRCTFKGRVFCLVAIRPDGSERTFASWPARAARGAWFKKEKSEQIAIWSRIHPEDRIDERECDVGGMPPIVGFGKLKTALRRAVGIRRRAPFWRKPGKRHLTGPFPLC